MRQLVTLATTALGLGASAAARDAPTEEGHDVGLTHRSPRG
jgi:hypothetical protein